MKTGNKEDKTDNMLEQEKLANECIKNNYNKKENKRNIDGSTVGKLEKGEN